MNSSEDVNARQNEGENVVQLESQPENAEAKPEEAPVLESTYEAHTGKTIEIVSSNRVDVVEVYSQEQLNRPSLETLADNISEALAGNMSIETPIKIEDNVVLEGENIKGQEGVSLE